MILAKVEYESFDHEEPSPDVQELDRQSGPGSEPYSVASAESSFFPDTGTRELDVPDG